MKKLIHTEIALSVAAMPALAQTNEWHHFNIDNSALPSNAATAVAVNNQGIWAGTEQGLARLGGEPWPDLGAMGSGLPQCGVYGIHTSNDGTLWVATDQGLAFHADRNWTMLNTANSEIPTDHIRCVTTDSDGNVWVGTWGSGILRLREGEWEVFNTENSSIPSNGIFALSIDDADRVWAGTYASGVAVLDGEQWTVHDAQSSGLPNNHVRSITFGRDGSVWLGTENGLARMMPDHDTVQVYISMYFGRTVNAFRDGVTSEDGVTWFATDAGLLRWEEGVFSFLHTSNSDIASNNLAAVTTDGQGNIIIGHAQKGIDIYNPDGVALPVQSDPLHFSGLEIFPNPVKNGLTVKIPMKGDAQYNLTVTDLSGRMVINMHMQQGITAPTLDVSALRAGTYLLTVRSANMNSSARFIKG